MSSCQPGMIHREILRGLTGAFPSQMSDPLLQGKSSPLHAADTRELQEEWSAVCTVWCLPQLYALQPLPQRQAVRHWLAFSWHAHFPAELFGKLCRISGLASSHSRLLPLANQCCPNPAVPPLAAPPPVSLLSAIMATSVGHGVAPGL